jgi:hypothetical protein
MILPFLALKHTLLRCNIVGNDKGLGLCLRHPAHTAGLRRDGHSKKIEWVGLKEVAYDNCETRFCRQDP